MTGPRFCLLLDAGGGLMALLFWPVEASVISVGCTRAAGVVVIGIVAVCIVVATLVAAGMVAGGN